MPKSWHYLPLAHALVQANYSDQQISPREKVA
ncbi:hypothetical protein AFAE65S_02878 [Alcaligenes phenolicus]